jgi:hypothetical protein
MLVLAAIVVCGHCGRSHDNQFWKLYITRKMTWNLSSARVAAFTMYSMYQS